MKKKNDKFGKKMLFVIELEPYNQQCIVLVNSNIKEAVKFLDKQNSPNSKIVSDYIKADWEEFNKSVDLKGGKLYHTLPHGFIMSVNHLDSWIDTVALVSHETFHLVSYLFRRIGIELTEESEEAYTYLIQKTVEKILREIY